MAAAACPAAEAAADPAKRAALRRRLIRRLFGGLSSEAVPAPPQQGSFVAGVRATLAERRRSRAVSECDDATVVPALAVAGDWAARKPSPSQL